MAKGLSIILPALDEPGLQEFVDHIRWVMEQKLPVPFEILIQDEPGLTNAVYLGIQRSSYDTILVMDADGSHDPHDIPEMWYYANMPWCNLVVGYKVHDETAWYRRLISRIYRGIARQLVNKSCKDPMSGFTCGDRNLYEQIQPGMGYKYLLQLLVLNPNITNLPIAFHKREQGKSKANLVTGIRTLFNIIKYSVQQ